MCAGSLQKQVQSRDALHTLHTHQAPATTEGLRHIFDRTGTSTLKTLDGTFKGDMDKIQIQI